MPLLNYVINTLKNFLFNIFSLGVAILIIDKNDRKHYNIDVYLRICSIIVKEFCCCNGFGLFR